MPEKLSIRTCGNGPGLVLLHGWAMNSGIWDGVAARLAGKFSLHLVDLPGHGVNRDITMPAQLDQLADQIQSRVGPASWLGWSLGGLIALRTALLWPHKVDKLVMVSATPSFSRRDAWPWGADEDSRREFADGVEHDTAATVGRFLLQAFGARHLSRAMERLAPAPFTENAADRHTLLSGLRLLFDNDLVSGLGKCNVPMLFLGGSRDRVVNPESFRQAASLAPNAECSLFRGAGHAPFVSHRDEFLEIVFGFLERKSIT